MPQNPLGGLRGSLEDLGTIEPPLEDSAPPWRTQGPPNPPWEDRGALPDPPPTGRAPPPVGPPPGPTVAAVESRPAGPITAASSATPVTRTGETPIRRADAGAVRPFRDHLWDDTTPPPATVVAIRGRSVATGRPPSATELSITAVEVRLSPWSAPLLRYNALPSRERATRLPLSRHDPPSRHDPSIATRPPSRHNPPYDTTPPIAT